MAGNRAVTFTGSHRMEVQDERSPKKYVIEPHNVTEFAAPTETARTPACRPTPRTERYPHPGSFRDGKTVEKEAG
jgi:hypothetical protein